MKWGKLIASILFTALLLGCGSAETVAPTTATVPPETKPVTVYAGAVEDYLNPVQAYSRPERKNRSS